MTKGIEVLMQGGPAQLAFFAEGAVIDKDTDGALKLTKGQEVVFMAPANAWRCARVTEQDNTPPAPQA